MRSNNSSPESLASVGESNCACLSDNSFDQASLPPAPDQPSAFHKKMAFIAGLFSALGLGACQGFNTDSALGRGLGFQKNDSYGLLSQSLKETPASPAFHSPQVPQNYNLTDPNSLNNGTQFSSENGSGLPGVFRSDVVSQRQGLLDWHQFSGGFRGSVDRPYQASWGGSASDYNLFEQIYDKASNRVEDFLDLATSDERITEWGVKRILGQVIGQARNNYLQEIDQERVHGSRYSSELYDPLWGLPAITNRTRYRLSLPSVNDIRRQHLNIGFGFETPLSGQTAVSLKGEWAEGGDMQLALVCQTIF